MKKIIKVINIVFIFIVLLLCYYLISNKINNQNNFEDILFLKFFHNKQDLQHVVSTINKNEIEQVQKYIFKVNCKNSEYKSIDLLETVDKQTIINKKIAPGIEGSFQIILETNENTKYNVMFQTKKQKPKNLKFENLETKTQYNDLEEFNNELTGILNKNDSKVITIHWSWEYDNTEEEDRQDTIDSQNIQEYEFEIYAKGESVV